MEAIAKNTPQDQTCTIGLKIGSKIRAREVDDGAEWAEATIEGFAPWGLLVREVGGQHPGEQYAVVWSNVEILPGLLDDGELSVAAPEPDPLPIASGGVASLTTTIERTIMAATPHCNVDPLARAEYAQGGLNVNLMTGIRPGMRVIVDAGRPPVTVLGGNTRNLVYRRDDGTVDVSCWGEVRVPGHEDCDCPHHPTLGLIDRLDHLVDALLALNINADDPALPQPVEYLDSVKDQLVSVCNEITPTRLR